MASTGSGSLWTGAPGQGTYEEWVAAKRAKDPASLAPNAPKKPTTVLGHLVQGVQELGDLPLNLFSEATTGKPAVNFPDTLSVGGGGKKAPAPTPAPATTTTTTPDPKQQSIQSLLSAILGGQTGTIPQGYANFFTDVLAPMMQSQASDFDKQLKATGADPNVLANLMAINDATAKQSGLGALGLQQFVQGPLQNYQKLVQQLQNALSFIPYSAQGIAQMPVQAGSVLSQLGINPGAAALLAPGATPGQAPSLSPGAAVVAGG